MHAMVHVAAYQTRTLWRFGLVVTRWLINVVALRQTRLVLESVTVCGRVNHLLTSQLGRLSLLPSVGR